MGIKDLEIFFCFFFIVARGIIVLVSLDFCVLMR